MEDHAPGTDAALLNAGHITCTFLGGIQCRNADYSADFGAFWSGTGLFS